MVHMYMQKYRFKEKCVLAFFDKSLIAAGLTLKHCARVWSKAIKLSRID